MIYHISATRTHHRVNTKNEMRRLFSLCFTIEFDLQKVVKKVIIWWQTVANKTNDRVLKRGCTLKKKAKFILLLDRFSFCFDSTAVILINLIFFFLILHTYSVRLSIWQSKTILLVAHCFLCSPHRNISLDFLSPPLFVESSDKGNWSSLYLPAFYFLLRSHHKRSHTLQEESQYAFNRWKLRIFTRSH